MSLKPYPKYKDSGVEWLGDVPEDWVVGKLAYFCKLKGGFAFSATEFGIEGIPVVRMNNLKRGHLELAEAVCVSEKSASTNFALAVGDIVWGMSGSIGDTGSLGNYARVRLADLPCQLNQRVGKFILDQKMVHDDYFEKVIQSKYFYDQILLLVTGTAQSNVSSEQVQSCIILRPSLDEQSAIATFLDHEASKIDALIAEQEKLITLLAEKRQATISHAVTKGLNPDVKMKDSGVEWLGEVPEGWEIMRLKHVGSFKAGAGFPHDEQGIEGEALDFHKVNALGQAGPDGYILPSENTISRETALRLGASEFPENTIIFAKIGAALLLGRIRLLKQSACLDNNLMGLIVSCDHSVHFVCFWMSLVRFDLLANPGTVPSLNEPQIANVRIAVPSFEEQIKVVEFLRRELAKLDTLIAEADHVIDLLKERRTALISAAVTGKIDVRAVVQAEQVAA